MLMPPHARTFWNDPKRNHGVAIVALALLHSASISLLILWAYNQLIGAGSKFVAALLALACCVITYFAALWRQRIALETIASIARVTKAAKAESPETPDETSNWPPFGLGLSFWAGLFGYIAYVMALAAVTLNAGPGDFSAKAIIASIEAVVYGLALIPTMLYLEEIIIQVRKDPYNPPRGTD